MMLDYIEGILEIRREIHLAEEAMLKGNKKEAVEMLEKMSDVAKLTAAWIESDDNYQ